ncbi:polysaccharide biosynthesis protein [Peribacillus simplex]|uniref:oligosaccharide flippase family protein n=1 Tax=Peribacillus simplex TaxID=1478 RepID=UPI000F63D576|nr:oligosaccharide flippase family protein [Peribacillus simplex]RRN69922.1 polysaccharide biosynthesis protein [Peribacillus simplex]
MNYFKKTFKSNFAKSVLIVTSGTALAQILSLSLSPIITRMYTPEEYGFLTAFSAILGLLTIVGSFKYELGIAIAEDDEKAINVLALCLIVLLAFVGIVTVILILFGKYFLSLFNGETLIDYILLVPIGILFVGLYNIFMQWGFRKKDFKSISITKLSQSLFSNFIKIGLGLFSLGPIGLILGNIIGTSSGLTTLSMPLIRKERDLVKKINIKGIIWSAKRYIGFPMLSAPSQFFNAAGIQLPILFITSLYGTHVIGFYGLANGVVNMPMVLLGKSVSDVFYGEAASIGRTNPERLKDLSIKLIKKLILIGVFPFIILLLFSPYLFSFVFGTNWYEAGVFARIIALLVFLRFVFTPISRVYSVFERQKEALFLDVLRVILVLIVFLIAKVASLSSYWAVGLYTIVMSIIYLLTFILALKIINEEIAKKVEEYKN